MHFLEQLLADLIKCYNFLISAFLLLSLFIFQVEPIRNLFAALFLSSIGMLINVQFLWNHADILIASVISVIVIKTLVIGVVVRGFGYSIKTSFLVRNIPLEVLNFVKYSS